MDGSNQNHNVNNYDDDDKAGCDEDGDLHTDN